MIRNRGVLNLQHFTHLNTLCCLYSVGQNFPSFDSKTQDIVLQTISSSTLICTHDSYVNTRRCKQLYKYSPVFSDVHKKLILWLHKGMMRAVKLQKYFPGYL